MILDRLNACMSCSRRRRKRTVPDLELDDILALGFQGFRHCQDIKSGFGVQPLGKSAESDHGRSNSKNQTKSQEARSHKQIWNLVLSIWFFAGFTVWPKSSAPTGAPLRE